MVEIVDGVLQVKKGVFLPFALACNVAQRPDCKAAVALALAERPDTKPQPPRRAAFDTCDAHFFLQTLAFTGRFEQPVDRFGSICVANEYALNRTHIVAIRCVDQIEISFIGVNHATAVVGDDHAVEGAVHNRLDQRADGGCG